MLQNCHRPFGQFFLRDAKIHRLEEISLRDPIIIAAAFDLALAFGAHRQSRLHTAKRSLVQSTCHTPYCDMDIRLCSQSKRLELYLLPDMLELPTADIDWNSPDSFLLCAKKKGLLLTKLSRTELIGLNRQLVDFQAVSKLRFLE